MLESLKKFLDKVDNWSARKAEIAITRGVAHCNGSPYDFGRTLARDGASLARNWATIDKIVRKHGTISAETLDEIKRGIKDAA